MLTVPISEKDHYQGALDSAVILVEYGDFECQYCGEAYPIIKQLKSAFGNKLCFVFRNFPLSETHPYALHAAYAVEAAGIQGLFWPMHDVVYEHQTNLDDESLFVYGAQVGVNIQEFKRDFESAEVESKIQNDFTGGIESGVNGTPTFFINGNRHNGSYLFSDLEAAIKSEIESI